MFKVLKTIPPPDLWRELKRGYCSLKGGIYLNFCMVQCYSHFQDVTRYHSQPSLYLGDILIDLFARDTSCAHLLHVHILNQIHDTNGANVGEKIYLRLLSSMQRM